MFSSSGGALRRASPGPREHRVVYAHATDRYFERRPETPPQHAGPVHYSSRRA